MARPTVKIEGAEAETVRLLAMEMVSYLMRSCDEPRLSISACFAAGCALLMQEGYSKEDALELVRVNEMWSDGTG